MGYSGCDTEDDRSPAEKVGTPLCICCTKHLSLYCFVSFLMRPIHANMFVYAQYVSSDDTRKTARVHHSGPQVHLIEKEIFCLCLVPDICL